MSAMFIVCIVLGKLLFKSEGGGGRLEVFFFNEQVAS